MSESYKIESRKNWSQSGFEPIGDERIKLGCLQRIADATELMVRNHQTLVNDCARYKRWADEYQSANAKLLKSNAALRGYINRMKREAKS